MRRAVWLLAMVALLACDRENAANPDVSKNSPARPGGDRSAPAAADNRQKMNPIAPPQSDLPANRIGGVTTAQVRVELNEYDIRMPATLPSGKNSLLVVNSGKDNHGFVIEGNGVNAAVQQPLTRGDSAQLDVTLKPGNYTVYCPIDGHKGKGMSRTITVQ